MPSSEEDQVLVSLAVDTTKLEAILVDHRLGNINTRTARQQINDLYEYNARSFTVKLNLEANKLMTDQLALTEKLGAEQHDDLVALIEAIVAGRK